MPDSLLPRLRRPKKNTRVPRIQITWDWTRFLIAFSTVVILTVLLSIHFIPDPLSITIGDRSPTEIRAVRSVTYTDTLATDQLRAEAALATPRIFAPDSLAAGQASAAVADLFETVRRIRSSRAHTTPNRRFEALIAELGSVFSRPQARYLAEARPDAIDRLRTFSGKLVATAMRRPIRADTEDLAHVLEDFAAAARRDVSSATEAGIVAAVGRRALRPNQRLDELRTSQFRDAEMRRVRPVRRNIRQGDVILHAGDAVTQRQYDQCVALGLISPRLEPVTFLAILGLSAVMVGVVGFYLRREHPRVYQSPRLLLLLCGIVTVGVLGIKLFGQLLGVPLTGVQMGYFGMMAAVAAGMIIAVLLDAHLALLVTALLSVLSGLAMNQEIRFAVVTMVTSLVGIYSVSDIRARGHLLRATGALGLTSAALVWIIGGLLGDSLHEVVTGTAWAVLSAGFAVGIFWFVVTLLERPFGILTHAWLLELSASDHPLLRELTLTAPGTYAHSVMVGNLAEAAAEAIGADSLFCRVASYYHDVGKMKRPHCYIENQHGENVHDRLNPSLSALIITSHVRDGLELADQHKLPAQFKAIIAEHHGTTLIRYFYSQAVAQGGAEQPDPILEQHYRYDGPKPQTRESGIIMLADTVEAALRTLDKPTPSRIQDRIEVLIHDKMTDGQLDECDLTFKDIHKIQAAFTRVLSAMMHGRIDYPELPGELPKPDEARMRVEVVTTGSLAGTPVSLPKPPEERPARHGRRRSG